MGKAPEVLKTGNLKKIIMFEFYKKTMTNQYVILKISACPKQIKVATAITELSFEVHSLWSLDRQ